MTRTPTRIRAVAAVVTGLLAAAALLLGAAPADAHPAIAWSTPGEGAVLDAPPEDVTISFGEQVEAPIGSIRVYDLDSERVDLDDARLLPDDPRTVTVSLAEDLPDGTYVVIWRAVGLEDGHLVIGQQNFTVGAAAGAAAPAAPAIDVEAGVGERVAPVLGAVTTVAVLAGAGGTLFALVLLGRRDERWAPARRRTARAVRAAAVVGVAGSLAAIPVAAAVRAGTWAAATDPTAVLGVVAGAGGAATLLRALLLLPLVSRTLLRVRVLVVTGWVVALATLAVDGHVAGVVGALAGVGHVAAGAAWAGGLLALALVLPLAPQDDARGLGDLVARFGSVALVAVAVAGVAGGAQALATSPDVAASVATTTWGGLLLDKTLLLGGALLLAAHTRFVVQPRLAAASRVAPAGGAAGTVAPPEGPPDGGVVERSVVRDDHPDPRRSLRRNVVLEAVLVVAVMGAGGAMAGLDPTPVPEPVEAPAGADVDTPVGDAPGGDAPAGDVDGDDLDAPTDRAPSGPDTEPGGPTAPDGADCPEAPLVEGEQAHGEEDHCGTAA